MQPPLIQEVGPHIDEAITNLREARDTLCDPERLSAYARTRMAERESEWTEQLRGLLDVALADGRLGTREQEQILDKAEQWGMDRRRAASIIEAETKSRGAEIGDAAAPSPPAGAGGTLPLPQTHYEILGVSETATAAEIEEAFRREHRLYIQDTDKARASARLYVVSQAHEVLRDPVRRAQYDAWLRNQPAGAAASARGTGAAGPPLLFSLETGGPLPASFRLVAGSGELATTPVIVVRSSGTGVPTVAVKASAPWLAAVHPVTGRPIYQLTQGQLPARLVLRANPAGEPRLQPGVIARAQVSFDYPGGLRQAVALAVELVVAAPSAATQPAPSAPPGTPPLPPPPSPPPGGTSQPAQRARRRPPSTLVKWLIAVAVLYALGNGASGAGRLTAPVLRSPGDGATGVPLRATLTWAPVQGATSYRVQASKSGTSLFPLVDYDGITGTSATFSSDLAPQTSYWWRIAALNSNGMGPWSPTWDFTTEAEAAQPATPTGAKPASPAPTKPGIPAPSRPAKGAKGVSTVPLLDWAAVNGASTYRVQVAKDPGFESVVFEDTDIYGSQVSVLPELAGSTQYWWRVAANLPSGQSGWSTIRDFTTVAVLPGIPLLSYPLYGTTDAAAATVLSWQPVRGAAYYRVQVAADADFSRIVFDRETSAVTATVAPELGRGTKYWWRVRASNASGNGSWTSGVSFRIAGNP